MNYVRMFELYPNSHICFVWNIWFGSMMMVAFGGGIVVVMDRLEHTSSSASSIDLFSNSDITNMKVQIDNGS